MIKKYDKDTIELLGKTTYYVALSAVQKCIRRGDPTRAVNFAKVAWRINPYRLWNRLWTILYEDCGRDLPTLLMFYKHRGGGYEFENLIPLIVQMANADKSRESNLLSYWLGGEFLDKDLLHAATVGTIHHRLVEILDEWTRTEFHAYSIWDYGVGNSNLDWTIEVAERSIQFDWEKFGRGSPYFFMQDTCEVSGTFSECGHLTILDNWMPSEAIDCHTMPGKQANRTFIKYHPETDYPGVKYDIPDGLGEWLFWHEGWLYRHSKPYQGLDFFGLFQQMQNIEHLGKAYNLVTEEATASMKRVIEEMHKIRLWTMQNSFKRDFDALKWAYADQWVIV